MNLLSLLACPRCRSALAEEGDSLWCAGCHHSFDVLNGIPALTDARVRSDPSLAAEWAAQHYALPEYLGDSVSNAWYDLALPRVLAAARESSQRGVTLDLGCGVGKLGKASASAPPGSRLDPLVGVDFQRELIERATVGYACRIEADMHVLPLRSASVRTIIAANTLHHAADPARAVAEAARVLEPGGTIVLYDPRKVTPLEHAKKILRRNRADFTQEHRAFRADDLRGYCEASGLSVACAEAVDPLGPLVAAGLDLLGGGKTGLAGPMARCLVALDGALVRRLATGLMLMVVATKPR